MRRAAAAHPEDGQHPGDRRGQHRHRPRHQRGAADPGRRACRWARGSPRPSNRSASDAFKQMYVDATDEDVILIKSPVGLPGRSLRSPFTERLAAGTEPRDHHVHRVPQEVRQAVLHHGQAGQVAAGRRRGWPRLHRRGQSPASTTYPACATSWTAWSPSSALPTRRGRHETGRRSPGSASSRRRGRRRGDVGRRSSRAARASATIRPFDATDYTVHFAGGRSTEASMRRASGREGSAPDVALPAVRDRRGRRGARGRRPRRRRSTRRPERSGVIVGSGIGGLRTDGGADGGPARARTVAGQPDFSSPGMIVDLAAGHISIRHGLQGHQLRARLGVRDRQPRHRRGVRGHPARRRPT